MKPIRIISHLVVLSLAAMGLARAADIDEAAAAARAAESIAYCKTTIKDRPTPPDVIVAKVREACALLEKEGPAAFPKFYGKDSPFIYEGTYIFVQAIADGLQYVHPMQHKLIGARNMSMKDVKGKRFFAVMTDVAQQQGEGWVSYYWPKPGTQEFAQKIAFVKKCKMSDGVEVVVGSGAYQMSDADAAKLQLH